MQQLVISFFRIMMLKDEGAFDTEKDFSGVSVWKQWLSLIILVLTLLAMIFEDKIGVKLCISGGIGALASNPHRSYFRERCTEIHRSQDNLSFWWYAFPWQQHFRKQEPVN